MTGRPPHDAVRRSRGSQEEDDDADTTDAALLVGALALGGCGRGRCGREVADGAPDATADDGGDDGDRRRPPSCEDGETDGDLLLYNWSRVHRPGTARRRSSEEFGVSVDRGHLHLERGAAGPGPSGRRRLRRHRAVRLHGRDHDRGGAAARRSTRDADPEHREPRRRSSPTPPYDPGPVYSMPVPVGHDRTRGGPRGGRRGRPSRPGAGVRPGDAPATGGDRDARRPARDDGCGALLPRLRPEHDRRGRAAGGRGPARRGDRAGSRRSTRTCTASCWCRRRGRRSTHGFSGNFFQAFDGAEDPDRYAYLIPEEGATRWVDNMAILGRRAAPVHRARVHRTSSSTPRTARS